MEQDIRSLFERYGTVVSLKRGTSNLSLPDGSIGDWGSGWIWNGEWTVRIKVNEFITLPRFVAVNGGSWEIRVDGSPPACFKCGDLDHRAGSCRAEKREEALIWRWDEELGQAAEVFFPTEWNDGMSEEDFQKKRDENIKMGNDVGVRRNPGAAYRQDSPNANLSGNNPSVRSSSEISIIFRIDQ